MQHLLLALELQQGIPSSDGWIEDLSDMTQGVGITQRVGDRIAQLV